jgi:hypothetical protein
MIDLNFKQLIDKPDTSNVRPLDRMIGELSPFLNEYEIDQAVSYLELTHDSRFDINLSIGDAAEQMKLILGKHRYEQVKALWASRNQHLIGEGIVKYIRLSDNSIWDGLDPTDNPLDYKRIQM